MTVKLKVAALRDGDIIATDNGTYTVKSISETKRTIPKRYVKQRHLVLESKTKINGRSARPYVPVTFYNDDEVEVITRPGMQWKIDRFKDKYHNELNTVACATAGSIISLGAGLTGLVPGIVALGMLGVTAVLSFTLYLWSTK